MKLVPSEQKNLTNIPKIIFLHIMDDEIYDGNFSISDYENLSIPLDFAEQSENGIDELSEDYHYILLKRKI